MNAAKLVAIAGAMALVSACTTVDAEMKNPDPADEPLPVITPELPDNTCAAEAYQHFVGQRIGEIHTESLPSPLRIYSTLDMVTMDYRAERMNIVTTPQGVVIEVKCG